MPDPASLTAGASAPESPPALESLQPLQPLPPGQRARKDFPRFGHTAFADRFPARPRLIELQIGGDLQRQMALGALWDTLPRTQQHSDFHCVTTWSKQGLRWGGVRFRDVHAWLAQAGAGIDAAVQLVEFRAQDGYRSALPLADLLADDVLLADELDGMPLPLAHGAPLRLVAPAHYGYKNVKHLKQINFLCDASQHKPVGPAFMAHPRARVAQEERGQIFPGWLLRWLYRPLIAPTAQRFAAALARHADVSMSHRQ